ncbi:hemagglutinin repeat-containing protein, partial [Leeia sp.]|uniref:hemagglutinin repeat-containing protein n=1 Tax=Leeia sp. TaxID=2884678 RepID=UPI0035AE9891
MNKNLYRLVFNQARGLLIVVAEIARRSHGQAGSGEGSGAGQRPGPALRMRLLSVSTALALGSSWLSLPAGAEMIADPNAPANQRPTIINAGNGVPVVNIQTPSAAGVSRNTYSQFDVNPQGVVLNNSRAPVQTQQAGWVDANPWLANGTARIILNEVNSNQPSLLRGFIEVGGSRAQVIVANPAGITCDGCGFINANRATLTTGIPQWSGGDISGYRVENGLIRIEGAGLNNRNVDYTDLLSRAIVLNAGLWGQEVRAITGSNQISTDLSQVTPIAASGSTPSFSLDVAQLGGMYAGKIRLVGTEAGVGVRNAGTLQASAGQFVVTSEGKLENKGTLTAQGALEVTARQGLENSGAAVISGATEVSLKTDGTLDNSARIYGSKVSVQADQLRNRSVAGQAGVIAAHEQLEIGARELHNQDHALLLSEQDLHVGRTLDAQGLATGQADVLANHSATLEATRDMTLKARQIDNINDNITTRMGAATQTTVDEYQLDGSPNRYQRNEVGIGRNDPNEDISYLYAPDGSGDSWNHYNYVRTTQSTEIASTDPGRLLAGGKLTIEADTLNNDNSRIMAGGDLLVTATTIHNTDTAGTRTISDNGTAEHYYRIQNKGHDSQGISTAAYAPPTTVQSITMGAAVYQGNAGLTAVTAAGSGGSVSNNALFQVNNAPTAHALIESDPRFTSYRQWLSSDYMLERLRLSPENMHKRLGDGFYEQRLVREQVAQLTGRRFLDGYANDEAQYRALLEQGATYAQQWQLRPGIALSAAQMARLTSDMVWLVEQQVTLADGSQHTVLVPQLYLRPRQGELNAQGGLMSGLNLRLNVSGDVISSGQLSGRQALALNADSVRLLGGQLDGNSVNVNTRSDLELQGGRILGEQSVDLQAGRDLIANSSTRTQSNAQGSRTNIDRVAGIYVSNAQGNLNAHANRNLTLNATEVANTGTLPTAGEVEGPAAGRIRLSAGQQLTLGTVTEQASHSIVWNGDNWRKDASSQQVGSQIHSQGDIQLIAGTDLTSRAATVSSDAGAIQVQATGNVNILAGEQTRALDEGHKVKGSNGLLSRKTTTTHTTLSETTAVGSTFSGDTVQIQAGQDVHIQGSQVGSTYGTEITAGHNLIIDAASNEQTQTTFKDVQKSGLFGTGGIGFTIGKQQQTNDTLTTTTTATGSLIGSTEGDVVLRAGQRYQQVGSDVVTGSGDIQIEGKQVSITETSESRHSEQNSKFKQSGLTVTLSNPVLSAAQTVSQMSKASKQTADPRMKALAAITAGAAVYNAVDAVQQNPGQAGGISISISIGSSKNESHSVEDQRNSRGSTVKSGGDLSIVARGAGQQSDLTVQGSQLKAAGDLTLSAEHDLNLLAARNSSDSHTTSSGKSGSIGIAFSLGGEKNGFSINAGGSKSKGQSNGNDVTWVNTQVEAGKQLTLKAGQDTNLIGAQAKGQRIVSQTGGNLTITSLQDSSDYHSQNSSSSFGVSLCIPPICAGASSVSASTSRSKLNSTWQSVTQQSGLLAGDGGFDVQVGQHTQLNGAVIASTDAAVR